MTDFTSSTTVRSVDAATSVVDVGGELTHAAEQDLSNAFATAASGDTNTVILNFSELDYMNSGGIGLLVTLLIRANRDGKRLLACGLGEHYRQIFSLTRLDEAITCFADEPAAIAAAR